jgi:hypothetical protein
MHLVLLLVVLFGCARVRVVPTPAAVAGIRPEAAPAPPQVAPKARAEAMNTEFYRGTAAEEAAMFEAFSAEIQRIQQKQAADHDQPLQRGFHAKSHACFAGTLEPFPQRDPRVRYGLYADDAPHPLVARFSNAVGWKQKDKALDARGMAVKILQVEGLRSLDDGLMVQDLLATNHPTPVGAHAEQFMDFARHNAQGTVSAFFYALSRPRRVAPAALDTQPIPSMVTETFWGGGAFHLGAHQASKFQLAPCAGVAPHDPPRSTSDYLGEDLRAAARAGELCYELGVQLQVDPKRTPIEDAAVVWSPKDAPVLPVARVVFPAQEALDPAACDAMRFNPWHSLQAHQPMGHIHRARQFVYAASQSGRSAPAPTEAERAAVTPSEGTAP